MKSFDITESKLLYPYEFVTSNKNLQYPGLPDYEHWTLSLKNGENLLDIDYKAFQKELAVGKSEDAALKALGLDMHPLPGPSQLELYHTLY